MKRLVIAALLLVQSAFAAAPDTDGCRTERDIPYVSAGESDAYRLERCKLDLCIPEGAEGFATVVWFHGGGLTKGSKSIPAELRGRGYAVAAPNYRLSPRAQNPAYTEDAAEAVAWVFRNIEKYGGDPSKIYIAGHSAGGYLALMVALDKSWLAAHGIDADSLAGAYPVSGQTTTHYTIRSERGLPSDTPVIDRYAPSNNVRKTPFPIRLITGGRDLEMLARYEENLHLYALLKALGQEVSIFEMEGFGHSAVVSPACQYIDRDLRRREGIKKR